jgi:hypothetical protein
MMMNRKIRKETITRARRQGAFCNEARHASSIESSFFAVYMNYPPQAASVPIPRSFLSDFF